MKACWADHTEVPMSCVLNSGDDIEIYGCAFAKHITKPEQCKHWNKQLAVELCIEILGDGYTINGK